ncbi:hypothetical protein KGMB02408_35810 [Bacteroides faecalis]|uniref:Lipoprotein n=2 Tax=Bacteroides faecalis TaxID=2447885 RepID=A0A401LYL4_9BACE|nr:hypothetical protein KGMB02408_35810 [Bacteroides faecalis]
MKKQMKNMKKLLLLSFTAIALSSCDFCALGKIENQTNDTIRIVCYTTESLSTFYAKGATKEYNDKTGGYFFRINRNGNEGPYHQLNDSTVYFDIAPKSSFNNIRMGMNFTWSEERVQTFLSYIKRMEIRTPNNTLVYNGGKQLNNLF